MIQISKPKYPNKQTINFAKQESNKVDTRIQIGSFALFLIFLAVFVKFAVIGRIDAANEAKREYLETEQQIEMLLESTKDYEIVQKEYRKFNSGFLSESEAAEVDRMEIIDMVEDCVLDKADIKNINITANKVIIILGNTTLPFVSEIVASLEEDEKTSYVTVSTAGTGTWQKHGSTVSANIMVELKPEVKNNE